VVPEFDGWIVYRGPAKVVFNQAGGLPACDQSWRGRLTTATSGEPASYVLCAIAFDAMFQTAENITVAVEPPTR
jgi:hypothetical protein